jgi:hypothetical protein
MTETPGEIRGKLIALGTELAALLQQNGADLPIVEHVILNEPAFIPALIALINKTYHDHGLSREDLERLAQDCRQTLANDNISYCDPAWRRLSSFIIDGRALSRLSTTDIKLIVAWYQKPNTIDTSEVPLSVSIYSYDTAETLHHALHYQIRKGMLDVYLVEQIKLANKLKNRSQIDRFDFSSDLCRLLGAQGIRALVELTTWTRQELLQIESMTTESVDKIEKVLHSVGLGLAG